MSIKKLIGGLLTSLLHRESLVQAEVSAAPDYHENTILTCQGTGRRLAFVFDLVAGGETVCSSLVCCVVKDGNAVKDTIATNIAASEDRDVLIAGAESFCAPHTDGGVIDQHATDLGYDIAVIYRCEGMDGRSAIVSDHIDGDEVIGASFFATVNVKNEDGEIINIERKGIQLDSVDRKGDLLKRATAFCAPVSKLEP